VIVPPLHPLSPGGRGGGGGNKVIGFFIYIDALERKTV